jgi:hypothetical protein
MGLKILRFSSYGSSPTSVHGHDPRGFMRRTGLTLTTLLLFPGCLPPGPGKPESTEEIAAAVVKGGSSNGPKHNFLGVFDPGTANWFLKMNRPGWAEAAVPDKVFRYGNPNDSPLVGDWDGDGAETVGVWRGGNWFLADTLGGAANRIFIYGNPDHLPFVGDWDGDGKATPGTFKNGTFFLRNTNTTGNADITFTFGAAGDLPVAGDWDGDGIDTVGVYRPSQAKFFLINKNASGLAAAITAQLGDPAGPNQPIIGDWDEDGVSTIGIKSSIHWFVRNENATGNGDLHAAFGNPEFVPVSGNWNPNANRGFSPTPAALKNFFPLAVFLQDPNMFEKWKLLGINTVHSAKGYDPTMSSTAHYLEDWTKEANRLGLKMIRNARLDPSKDANELNLLAWHIGDEPDRNLPGEPNDALGSGRVQAKSDRYKALKQINSRPVFFNFAGNLVGDPGDSNCNGPGDYDTVSTNCYPGFISAMDWISQDHYPVARGLAMNTTAQKMDKLTRWGAGKPQFTFIEASPVVKGGVTPSKDQFRGEIWDAIIHGARGIFYFPQSGCDPCSNDDGTTPDIRTEMTTQNANITGLTSVLQEDINPNGIGFRGALPLEASWRQSGGKYYYIVLNFSEKVSDFSFKVTGFTPSGPLTVVNEGRTLPKVSQSGSQTSFTDHFGAFEVHIYKAP